MALSMTGNGDLEMEKYHKIQTVWLRNPETKYKTLLENQWAKPEFEYLKDNLWTFTEKVDGTNIRVEWDNQATGLINFGGRTDKAQIPPFLLDKLNELFYTGKFFSLYPDTPMTLYGEGYGAKIQKGGGNYISDGVSFVLFDIMINGNWLDRENVENIANKLEIDTVPILSEGTLQDAINLVSQGFTSYWGSFNAEGLVARPNVELRDRTGNRVITKIKCKDFANE